MTAVTGQRFVDMRVADVVKTPDMPDCYIALLEERGGERRLLIWIAGSEAISLALRLAGMGRPARPLGADLSAALVEALGGRLVEVRVDRLDGHAFYATVVLDGPAASGRGGRPTERRPQSRPGGRGAGQGRRRCARPGGGRARPGRGGASAAPGAGHQWAPGARAIVEELASR